MASPRLLEPFVPRLSAARRERKNTSTGEPIELKQSETRIVVRSCMCKGTIDYGVRHQIHGCDKRHLDLLTFLMSGTATDVPAKVINQGHRHH